MVDRLDLIPRNHVHWHAESPRRNRLQHNLPRADVESEGKVLGGWNPHYERSSSDSVESATSHPGPRREACRWHTSGIPIHPVVKRHAEFLARTSRLPDRRIEDHRSRKDFSRVQPLEIARRLARLSVRSPIGPTYSKCEAVRCRGGRHRQCGVGDRLDRCGASRGVPPGDDPPRVGWVSRFG
jgi:hypothetical protein